MLAVWYIYYMLFGFTFDNKGNVAGEKTTLSYSAASLWHKSKEKYRAHYFEGEPSFTSPFTVFGSEVHRKVEHGEIVIPNHPHEKYHHELKLEASIGGVPMLAYIDMCNKDTKAVIDLKTSINAWTKIEVQKLDQLPLYVAMLREHYTGVHMIARVIWLETKWVEKEGTQKNVSGFVAEEGSTRTLALTDCPPVDIPRRIYLSDVKRVTEWVVRTAKEIDEDFTNYTKKK